MPNRHHDSKTAYLCAIAVLTLAVCAAAQPTDEAADANDSFIVYIGTNAYRFSPALPGELGNVKLHAILSHPEVAAARDLGRTFWRLEIRDTEGTLVRTARGRADLDDLGNALAQFTWDGRTQAGEPVPEGLYHYTFRARYLPYRVLARLEVDDYEEVELERPADEAYASTGDVVVDYALDVESSLVLRASRAAGACSVQQNTPIEAGFGYNFYYGGTHSHSNYSDGGQNPASCSSGATYGSGAYSPTEAYQYARDQAGLDFWAVTEHNHLMDDALRNQTGSLTEAAIRQRYQDGLAKAAAATVNGSFVALFGIEFGVLTNPDQGHVIVMESPKFINWETCSTCGATPECTPGTNCYFDVYAPKRYGYLQLYQRSAENPSPVGALGILCHPGASEFDNYAFNAYADEAMQGIAVRSGSAFSTSLTCADANAGTADYFARWTKALSVGFHVAPTGESDAHCANYGVAVPTRTVYLIPNSSTPVLTKTKLMQAHKARHFFATEDPNLQLVFATSDGAHIMGDIFSASTATLRVGVYDPDGESVSAIEIWRGQPGGPAPTAAYASNSNQSTFSITENLPSGTYYYFVHVRQADGHDAYSAPMWITFTGATTYSITGNTGTGGATVTAGGVSATADASGNYTVSGLTAGTYTVTPAKSGCTFTPASRSVTLGPNATGVSFTATCGTGDTQLTSGVPLTGQTVAYHQWKYYYITVPSGATSLKLMTTGASADADIYTQIGSKPTLTSYVCRPYSASGNETCTATNPAAGTWWLGVYGYAAATFSVTGTVTMGTTPSERLANGSFESITSSTNTAPDGSWVRSAYTGTSYYVLTANGSYPHGGTDYATLGQYNASSQTLDSALVTLPSAATSATLSFWVSIVTQETSSTAYDTLKVQLVNSSGSVLATLATLSNANSTGAASTYVQKSYSLLAYKGQQVKVRFVATNGSTKVTTFRIDDVSLKSDG
ncbi:MAG TPA: pre-peptidase C-terminal domain-containing protein [Thermoanaerobaculaceae bacterium]|nr:pre-peptidase C-terminal domain-containing protein [Thermoanaerobaculaceae bacterium]HRS16958.1 pre-peptidase C-terminal domain-containing protein [Thermoanaerobaculaceae bacterium]